MSGYIYNVTKTLKDTFEGLSIAVANMIAPPVTVQYPEVDIQNLEEYVKNYKGPLAEMPKNYRGILEVDLSVCTSCKLCMKACPIDCIIITDTKCDKIRVQGPVGKEAVKTRTPTRFDIDVGKCMYCGLCVMPCPTGAIRHTQKFELNKDSLEDLVLRHVTEEEKGPLEKRGKEIEAEEAAKKAARKAEKEAKEKAEKKEDAE